MDYLEHSARCHPDKVAFADEKESITFAALAELGRSIGLAVIKQTNGETNRPVAVVTDHRAADIAAFMGVLYAGCFYIPLDGAAPSEYLDTRIASINPVMTINAKSLSELPRAAQNNNAPDSDARGNIEKSNTRPKTMTECDEPGADPDFDAAALERVRRNVLSTDPAYAIFTSGSTGVSKAAVVSHGAVVNLAEWLTDTFAFSADTVFAGQCPFYFDASVKEICSALKNAATVRLVPKKLFMFPMKALQYIQEHGVTVLPWAVSAMKIVANSGAFERFAPDGIKHVIFGGENMPAKILNIWKKAMPTASFTNVYGPSEITVDCSYYTVDRDFDDGESIPIGGPTRNAQLLLLDENRIPVADGEPGEIYVRGAGVGLGYLLDEERTSAAFMQNPLNRAYRDIVYKTGDIARRNEHGELVFLSRADYQVKHMGSRIELGEIETAAAGLEGVALACCIYDKDEGRILLFYEGTALEDDIMRLMRERLPRYMQPGLAVRLDVMPSTPNGKIDRLKVREDFLGGL